MVVAAGCCPRIGKTDFLIYDFVNNTANFDDPGQQYHRPKAVGSRPGRGQNGDEDEDDDGDGDIGPPPPIRPRPLNEFTVISEGSLEDVFRRRRTIIVGPDGLAMDRREYQDRWRERIQVLQETDPAVQKILAGEELSQEEWEVLGHKLNAPEFWFDEPALAQSVRSADRLTHATLFARLSGFINFLPVSSGWKALSMSG